MFSGGSFLESLVSGGGGGGGNTIPVPLSAFLVTTPEAALQSAHDQGYTSIAIDQPYTFTGGVTISAPRFQIWGYDKQITKEFNGDLITLAGGARNFLVRDFRVLAQGETYTGRIFADYSTSVEGVPGGDGWYENVQCLDAEDRVYEEMSAGAFTRGTFLGGNVACVIEERGAIKMNDLVDPSVPTGTTGNGILIGVKSSSGCALDCGKAQELKVIGMTTHEPVLLNGSIKTHLSNCRITTEEDITGMVFDPDGTSNRCIFESCSFGVPVVFRAPNVRLIGCGFNDLTLDCVVGLVTGVVVYGDLIYGENYQGASLRPTGIVRMPGGTNPDPTTTYNAADGDNFTLSANRNLTIMAPTNPSPGQTVSILFSAVTVDRTLALDTGTGAFDLAGFTLTPTTAGKTDIVTALYSRGSNKWFVTGYVKGDAAPVPGPRFYNTGVYLTQAGDGVSLPIPLPDLVSLVVGAVLLGFASSKNNQTHTWPAGWTKVEQTNASATFTSSWAWHIVDGTETATVDVAMAGTNTVAGIVLQYTDVNATPIDTLSVGSSAVAVTTRNVASINTVSNNARVVYFIMANTGGSGSDADPGGSWVERGDFGATPATHITYGDQYVATLGSASGAIALTGSASATYVARLIELNPV